MMRPLDLLAQMAIGFSVTVVACAPLPHTRASGAVSPLTLVPVDWNPARAPTGEVRAVAEAGDIVSVFSTDGATVFRSGAVNARDMATRHFIDGAVVPGVDGSAAWLVAISDSGRVYRLRGGSSFEDISTRYGLGAAPVRSAATLGARVTVLLLANEIVTVDGAHVSRWPAPGVRDLKGGGGLAAGTLEGAVDVFDFEHKRTWRYLLPGVRRVAVDSSGRIYATTDRALYGANLNTGTLELLYDAGDGRLGDLVASKDTVWFVDGEDLGVVDKGHVLESSGARVGKDAKLAPSPTGDVWVISQGSLGRFARAGGKDDRASVWTAELGPVFGRSCAACHLPNGVSGIDLSSSERWLAKRKEIRARVIEEKSMPPRGHILSDGDRRMIERWLGDSRP